MQRRSASMLHSHFFARDLQSERSLARSSHISMSISIGHKSLLQVSLKRGWGCSKTNCWWPIPCTERHSESFIRCTVYISELEDYRLGNLTRLRAMALLIRSDQLLPRISIEAKIKGVALIWCRCFNSRFRWRCVFSRVQEFSQRPSIVHAAHLFSPRHR